jgi:hypothetical protein
MKRFVCLVLLLVLGISSVALAATRPPFGGPRGGEEITAVVADHQMHGVLGNYDSVVIRRINPARIQPANTSLLKVDWAGYRRRIADNQWQLCRGSTTINRKRFPVRVPFRCFPFPRVLA